VRQAAVDREILFNNYEGHTKHCPHCSKALARVKQGIFLAKIIGVLSLIASVVVYVISAAAGRVVPVVPVFSWGLVSVLSWFTVPALYNLEGAFMHTHWRHADKKKLVEFSRSE
jgi:hypothetical protein